LWTGIIGESKMNVKGFLREIAKKIQFLIFHLFSYLFCYIITQNHLKEII
jgi:hypothetical protein